MRAGEVKVSYKAFIALLHLPEGTVVLAVEQDSKDRIEDCFRVIFTSPECPEVRLGDSIPWVNCTLHTEFCMAEERVQVVEGHITP
jgi:hypothetical protein